MNLGIITVVLALSSLLTPQSYRQSLYNSLDPYSVAEVLAFYELYPETQEGQKALRLAEELLGGRCPLTGLADYSQKALHAILALVNRDGVSEELVFSDEELQFIESLGSALPNRRLKGFQAQTEEEVLALEPAEIDLGRALLLSQIGSYSREVKTYEAMLDLMALQVKATLLQGSSQKAKIKALNAFVFEKMRFRFPPHSLYAKDIDLYTFLPSVLDNHLGVCLGVTTLYLALAQRIDLNLEVVTPPGHIYVCYREGDELINIETTARGVNLPEETYLSISQRSLQQRTIKEVVGMTHFNQASVFLHRNEFDKAVAAYERALPYLKGDPLINELLGFSYLLIGEEEKGRALLKEVAGAVHEGSIAIESRPIDYLNGKINLEGIRAIFLEVDEGRESILRKQEALSNVLKSFPEFREGWIQLAVSYLQLNRSKEGLVALQNYHAIDPNDPTVEYYLSALYGERDDYAHSWEHLKNAERITASKDHNPKALRELRRHLQLVSPL